MYISQEQLDKRLNSNNNLLNVLKEKVTPTDYSHIKIAPIPSLNPPPVNSNLPNENDKQRAARIARHHIDHSKLHGEYTVNPNISNDIVRSTIGILAETGTSSKAIQTEFAVTKNQIIGAKKSKRLKKQIEQGKDKVSELAIDRLMATLGLLTPDKMLNEKPKDLSIIAANISSVVARMKPPEEKKDTHNGVTIQVLAPQIRDVSSYPVIEV